MWAPGGAMTGTVETGDGPVKVQIIDRNGNGSFTDFGADAMIVGRSSVATYLSRTVVIGGELYEIDLDEHATSIGLTPFGGSTARFDMTSDFTTNARLISAVVRSADGQHSFDLGRHAGAVAVPAGTYEIVGGRLGLGTQTVRVAPGRAESIEMATGETRTFEWGGPVAGEFLYQRSGDQVVLQPEHHLVLRCRRRGVPRLEPDRQVAAVRGRVQGQRRGARSAYPAGLVLRTFLRPGRGSRAPEHRHHRSYDRRHVRLRAHSRQASSRMIAPRE